MDSLLVEAFKLAGTFGPVGTFILIVVLIIERAVDRGWIRIGKSDENASEEVQLKNMMREILSSQKSLRLHYNDETTSLLDSISTDQKKSLVMLENGFKNVDDKFREYDKYGIKAVCTK